MPRAMGITKLGGPEVLRDVAVDALEVTTGCVRLHVDATAYNNIDALLRREDFGLDFPIFPGSDVVGRIADGNGVGGRVIVNPGIPCGNCESCRSGHRCPYVHILGVHRSGGYRGEVVVPETQCYPLPDDLDTELAAAFPLAFLTSWRMLVTRANLQEGQSVLIWGANGSLGSAAINVAKARGAVVFAVVRNKAWAPALLEYGADRVLSQEDASELIPKLTAGRGVDVVFEGPGTPTWEDSLRHVAQGGVIVTAGITGGRWGKTDIEDLYYKQVSILGSRMGYAEEFEEALAEFLAGRLRPLVGDVVGLSEAASVHARGESGQRCGKIVMINDL